MDCMERRRRGLLRWGEIKKKETIPKVFLDETFKYIVDGLEAVLVFVI